MRKVLALAVFLTLASMQPAWAALLEPDFVRAHPFVRQRLETLLIASREAAVSPAARPAVPAPCNATDSGDSVLFTWTDVGGESGYYVFRDGVLIQTLGPDLTQYVDRGLFGTHSYCIMAFNADGVSDVCCETGIQTQLAPPSPCEFASAGAGFVFRWAHSAGSSGYRVFRDGALYATIAAPDTSVSIGAGPGPHLFCVEAFLADLKSTQCCASLGSQLVPPAPAPCNASNDRIGSIRLTWTDVEGEDGYLISRDGHGLATLPKDTTSYIDGITGSHHYCVQAFNVVGPSAPCCSDGSASLPSMLARLSWGTCDPQVHDQTFTGPGHYVLVLSAVGSANTNVGHDSELRIRPAVPDAWRFDDAGCQSGRLGLQVAGIDSCPPMVGTNPLAITSYFLDVDGSAALRLAIVYDDLTITANQRYILWKIDFDHTHSTPGSDADPATCDGASIPLNLTVLPQILISGGLALPLAMEPNDLPATWNGGQVKTQPVTWGRVKALYR